MVICAATVAHAAPAMPHPKITTNNTSPNKFAIAAKATASSGCVGDLHAKKLACATATTIAAGTPLIGPKEKCQSFGPRVLRKQSGRNRASTVL